VSKNAPFVRLQYGQRSAIPADGPITSNLDIDRTVSCQF
jgi:hypothetical protein